MFHALVKHNQKLFEDYNNFEEAVKFFCVFINNQRDYKNHFDYDKNYTNFSNTNIPFVLVSKVG